MNNLILSTLPGYRSASSIFCSINYEEDTVLENNRENNSSTNSRTFKTGTNFPPIVYCVVGAKVMFLTNSIIDKGISNSTCGVIVYLRPNGEPNVAFPTKDRIRVRYLTNYISKNKD